MLTKTKTCALIGLDGVIVEVEVDISPGLPAFTVVGLPDTSVQESRERVRAAIRNSGFEFPMRRITVSLAPADLRKAGPAYDLPIAVGILTASGQLVDHLRGDEPMMFAVAPTNWGHGGDQPYPVDLADVRGQEHVKRAMEVAAAGGPTYSCRALQAVARPCLLARCRRSCRP